jgi:hypothetical protein
LISCASSSIRSCSFFAAGATAALGEATDAGMIRHPLGHYLAGTVEIPLEFSVSVAAAKGLLDLAQQRFRLAPLV